MSDGATTGPWKYGRLGSPETGGYFYRLFHEPRTLGLGDEMPKQCATEEEAAERCAELNRLEAIRDAAPELLKACERARDALAGSGEVDEEAWNSFALSTLKIVDAAIQLARGAQ